MTDQTTTPQAEPGICAAPGCGHGSAYHDVEGGVPGCRLCPKDRRQWVHAYRPPVTCLGCIGCGGPDCIQRTTEPEPDQDARPASENTARATARRQLVSLGLAEWQAVALLLPVIAETYREVADDAEDGAHGDTWGTTPEEALSAFAAAYRKVAADCDLPGAPLPEATRALERERAAHEEHRQQLATALDQPPSRAWPDLIATARAAHAGRAAAQEQVRDYENRLTWETTCGEHARLLDALQTAEADARRAMEQRQQMAAERYAWQERGDRAEAAAKVCRQDAEHNGRRAERAEGEAQTERDMSRLRLTRAETAEAALARVRRVAGWAANGWSDLSPQKVLAALDGGSEQAALVPDVVEREQAAEPLLRAPDVAPHLAAALDRYLTAVAPLAEALRAALPDGGA